jgi:hypothetical protein
MIVAAMRHQWDIIAGIVDCLLKPSVGIAGPDTFAFKMKPGRPTTSVSIR